MAKAVFLEFEQELGQIHNRIEELENDTIETGTSHRAEITRLSRELVRKTSDIYRELSLMEEWIREGMKITPAEFASALRSSYIIYATWITEVATGKPASDFPQEMLEPIRFIKK